MVHKFWACLWFRDAGGSYAFTRQATTLLEKIAVCVNHTEPVLLVGETGTGKTSMIQYLAQQTGTQAAHTSVGKGRAIGPKVFGYLLSTGHRLQVINMNQQSDSSDLLGGYKPVSVSRIISPFKADFEDLFCQTFSRQQNQTFLGESDGVWFVAHILVCVVYSSDNWCNLYRSHSAMLLIKEMGWPTKTYWSHDESRTEEGRSIRWMGYLASSPQRRTATSKTRRKCSGLHLCRG